MNERYEDENALRSAVSAHLRSQGLPPPATSDWQRVWSDWPQKWLEPWDQADVEEIVRNLIALRPAKRPAGPKRPRGRRQRRLPFRLYDNEEQRRAEEASQEQASEPYLIQAIGEFREEIWGSPDPPFSDYITVGDWIWSHQVVLPLGIYRSNAVHIEYLRGPFALQTGWLGVFEESDLKDLSRLKELADLLCSVLGCFPALAVNFALTGEVPIVMPVTASVPLGPGRLSLHVNYPWVSRNTVQRLYARFEELRRREIALSWPEEELRKAAELVNRLSPRVFALRQFVYEMPSPWHERWKTWQKRYPEWAYASVGSMQASLSNALRRLENADARLRGLHVNFTTWEWERKGYIRITSRPPIPLIHFGLGAPVADGKGDGEEGQRQR